MKQYGWIVFILLVFILIKQHLSAQFTEVNSDQIINTAFTSTLYPDKPYSFPNSLTQNKWVVVNFWSAQCPSCIAEIPDLLTFFHNPPANTEFITVNIGNTAAQIDKATKQYSNMFPIIMDSSTVIAQNWGIDFTPTTLIINPEGKIIATLSGQLRENELRAKLNELNKRSHP